MSVKIKKPFELEKKRSNLASKGNYSELIKTYTLKNQEIEDKNSPHFWDDLNLRKHISKESDPMAYDRNKIVLRLLKGKNKVLNIGAGAGDLENLVLRKPTTYMKWYGIDISPKSINRLKLEFPQAFFKIGNINNILFKDKFFDCVILMEILEHIKPRVIFSDLKEVKRVLKNKGTLIVTVPINEGLEEMVKKGINPNAHVRVYSPELISAELRISGFKIISKNFLFAFHNNYLLKTLVANYLIPGIKKPNNVILFCKKI